ncbi:MAG: HAD family hydrolase [Flammeovirgaceae bacterium]|nr:HAD family hydrolase [Flammeovirgaceae bacterium]MDW8287161.1 HAD family hydrolase [Flammeovirgaceae bacterium]
MNKCVFLDRDGVINVDHTEYTYTEEKFVLIEGVVEALQLLKQNGFYLIIITNQAGISKGLYTAKHVWHLHAILQKACGNVIDALYYCPYHPSVSASIARKPDSLLFERAIAKFDISPQYSWMVGDRERDLIAAHKVGIPHLVMVENQPAEHSLANFTAKNLWEATTMYILKK